MACAALRRVRKHLGRRGAILLILGSGKICWGISFIVDPPQPVGLNLLTRFGDLPQWAWLWIICGTITFASAFARIGRDRYGFLAALVPPTVWATAYLAAVLTGDYSRGLWVAVWYLTSHVGVIMWAATVPEYSVPTSPRGRKEEAG